MRLAVLDTGNVWVARIVCLRVLKGMIKPGLPKPVLT